MSKTGKTWALGALFGILVALCFVGLRDGCAPKPPKTAPTNTPPPESRREKTPEPAPPPQAVAAPVAPAKTEAAAAEPPSEGPAAAAERTPPPPEYDYSRVEKYLSDTETKLTPPKHKSVSLESGIECWELLLPMLPAWLRNAGVPDPGKPTVLDSYAGWKLVKLPVTIRRSNRFKVPVKFTKDIYFVVDHRGHIRLWNLTYYPLRDNFDKIKSMIVEKH